MPLFVDFPYCDARATEITPLYILTAILIGHPNLLASRWIFSAIGTHGCILVKPNHWTILKHLTIEKGKPPS